MVRNCAIVALMGVVISSEALAETAVPETNNPFIPVVARLYDALELAAALSTVQKALNWPNNTPQDVVWLELMEGALHFGAGNKAKALSAFKRALLLDPHGQLPVRVSPRLHALFAKARQELGLPEQQTPRPVVERPPPAPPDSSPIIPPEPLTRPTREIASILVGLRGEADLLGSSITSAIAAEIGVGPLAGVVAVFMQRSPGVRVEGRYYFLSRTFHPYAAVGATTFFPDTAGRIGAGLVVSVGPVHFSVDAAYERIFNPSISYAPDVVLLSLGAGWRFPLTISQ